MKYLCGYILYKDELVLLLASKEPQLPNNEFWILSTSSIPDTLKCNEFSLAMIAAIESYIFISGIGMETSNIFLCSE